ncbi:pheromone-binding protein-related protein 6-like [Bombus pascuorum]|uniref:pheromone-binding protein-related protein 6-like n=1 Tax=Bombus pascuorum TaxID=65598 RepID=UPI002126B302|nr:pheromone-binding protein-related protein 6-like [Bombus pascuorum]
MGGKQALLYLGLVCLQTIFVNAVPDWIPPEIFDMVAEDKARCMSEHGTTQAQIDEVDQGVLKDDRSITCYMFCLLEAFSLVDDEGDIDADMLLGLLPDQFQARAESVMSKCTPAAGSDKCDKIYNLAKCAMAEAPDVWFIV